VLSCYVSLCSEFRVAHFFSFLCCPVTNIYVALCSEFRGNEQHGTQNIKTHNRTTQKN
jgi:hypothetical protein